MIKKIMFLIVLVTLSCSKRTEPNFTNILREITSLKETKTFFIDNKAEEGNIIVCDNRMIPLYHRFVDIIFSDEKKMKDLSNHLNRNFHSRKDVHDVLIEMTAEASNPIDDFTDFCLTKSSSEDINIVFSGKLNNIMCAKLSYKEKGNEKVSKEINYFILLKKDLSVKKIFSIENEVVLVQ